MVKSCKMGDDNVIFDEAGVSFVSDSNVSLFAPCGAPWISQNPGAVFLIANQKASSRYVIIVAIVVDSTDIELPLVGINWHWKRSILIESVLNAQSLIWNDWKWFCVVQKLSGSGNRFAFIFPSSKRVFTVQNYTSIFHVAKRPVRERAFTSFTTIFSISTAIKKLLLWEVVKSLVFNGQHRFHCSSGWKSPAWSTISLIINWSDDSFSSPIDWCRWGSRNLDCFELEVFLHFRKFRIENFVNELLFSDVSKLSDAHFISFGWVEVVLIDKPQILNENLESELFLGLIISSVKLMFEIEELIFEMFKFLRSKSRRSRVKEQSRCCQNCQCKNNPWRGLHFLVVRSRFKYLFM